MQNRTDISFTSGSNRDRCHGWLYSQTENEAPVVVMAHGLGGVKEMRLDAYAERFAAAGYNCLVFDYRNFGSSDGEPRQVIEVASQLADWAAAIAHARRILPASKVILWGSSFAGGHVLAASVADGHVAAVVSQCPHTNGRAAIGQLDFWTIARLTALALRDLATKLTGTAPVMVNLSDFPGNVGLMTGPGVEETSQNLRATAGAAKPPNKVAARIALTIGSYSPGRHVKDIDCPVMFCLCEKDEVAPAAAARRYAREAPTAEIREYPVGHFEIYVGEPFERAVADQVAFLRRHVPADATS